MVEVAVLVHILAVEQRGLLELAVPHNRIDRRHVGSPQLHPFLRASFTSLSMVVLSTVDVPVVEPEEPVLGAGVLVLLGAGATSSSFVQPIAPASRASISIASAVFLIQCSLKIPPPPYHKPCHSQQREGHFRQHSHSIANDKLTVGIKKSHKRPSRFPVGKDGL